MPRRGAARHPGGAHRRWTVRAAACITTSMADTIDTDEMGDGGNGGMIAAEPLRRALGERYLQYALSTIMHRALPDARDG